MKLRPFQILIIIFLFLNGCDSQKISEEKSNLDGIGRAGIDITEQFSSVSNIEKGGKDSTKVTTKNSQLPKITINLESSATSQGTVSPSDLNIDKENVDSYLSETDTEQDDDLDNYLSETDAGEDDVLKDGTKKSFGSLIENKEIKWSQLRQLNVRTGEMPSGLKNLMGRPVKIPGYAVPIEGDSGFDFVSEFLLVPVFGMCIHVPPPPPNQVIFVKMKEPVPFEELLDAIWLYGVLDIGEFMVGGEMIYETETSYLIEGDKVIFYEYY